MSTSTTTMTEDERAIWRAAYAAAFVSDLHSTVGFYLEQRAPSAFDRAMQSIAAENAIGIADAAVRRLRQWREREQPLAGAELGSWPKDWEPDE
jgi:hypothetical protein